MDIHRAQQILAADDKIEVELHGLPVWIDSVDSKLATAKVHSEENPADTRTVSVQELEEVR
ncbi:H-type small acid-soluble spore protein [Paenibacillus hexagrammi]|uniref:H-type small acid-soluble spore protein n=1 Tax=Paenibacillus hexagrammi TaxID=2908839 RepID=A0ABY3SJL8_9BACL|nr:H-type small acid-soluble spore protein [Paenibacillus sp. YPD9-1]UJF34252.1 H-type small acid-soluble spore protein [Paenibacillus sp. YPD9-1]